MNHRIRFTVLWFIIKIKTFEEFFFYLEHGFQCGDGQGFSETAGAGKKISCTAWPDQLPDVFGLVHIQEIPLYHFFKPVNVAGQIFHSAVSCNLIRTIHCFFYLSSFLFLFDIMSGFKLKVAGFREISCRNAGAGNRRRRRTVPIKLSGHALPADGCVPPA